MPTYEYRREDGTTFEVTQRITDEPLERCPTTGQRVKRLIGGGAGLIFKGSGFYLTDYARKGSPTEAPANGSSKTEEKPAKSEAKADGKDKSGTGAGSGSGTNSASKA